MKKKKICFVVSSIITARFFLRYHIEVLSKYYDVYLVGNFNGEDITSLSDYNLSGIKSIQIERKISLIKDILSVFIFALYINKMKFDSIHSLAPKAGFITALAGKIVGTSNRIHIFTGQVWHTKKGFKRFLLKQFDRFIVKLNTSILVDGESQRRYLISEGIANYNNTLVLGKGSISGVDANRFFSNTNVRRKLRRELKISENSIVFLFMGRVNKDKGIVDLAKAFKNLLLDHNNIFLLIVGYDEEDLIVKIENIINDNLCFQYYGPTNMPEELIQVGDIFCLPSYREGFGTGVIEASMCKLAVLCSDTYGLSDAIIDNKTGLIHRVGDIADLTNKMKILLNDQSLIKNLGENGYENVMSNFSAETISNEWLNFYNRILS